MENWCICCYILVFIARIGYGQVSKSEPTCYSRFDYEHKVLTSLVTLEMEQRNTDELLKLQTDKVERLQAQLQDTQNEYRGKLLALTESFNKAEAIWSVQGTGSTYIRYGRTTCPGNGTELVYEGYVGGSDHSQGGGGVNYLCLPKDPIWGEYVDGSQGGAHVYGTEYQLEGRQAHISKFLGSNLFDQDAPCAVCRTKRSSVIMLPARNECYDGWTKEYHGYLVGSHSSHGSAEFVCLDIRPEVVEGGSANHNGKLFYFTKVHCGSLKCPPYVENRELTCAVCSK